MSDYDFKTLNDKEFEVLCTDLLSKHFGNKFERFKSGRDLGVDGRFFSEKGGEVVLQCKHWAKTPVAQMISMLKTKEKPKLDALKPERYILAVSNELSRLNKQQIFDVLKPHLKCESDIFGCEDLNDLLRKNPDVERQHYKLWMHSIGVLENIINRSILGRSRDEMYEIQDRFNRYVVTSNHENAALQLENLRVVIITGEPGVGKTTLADQLCYQFSAVGYEFLKLGDDITEAEQVLDEESKQLFYFDDFLGRNYLEALTGHEGSKIVSFMKRISRNKNKLFVLTSRSTILNQGKTLLDIFQHQNIERNEYELKMRSLSSLEKAKILYNHIWFSDLAPEYVEELYKDNRYLRIIKHKNFNPRLISYITDVNRLDATTAEKYWSYIEDSLENPANIWENPFMAQQDDFSRALIILTVFNGRKISEKQLSQSYHNYISLPANQNMKGRQDFQLNLKSLTGSFLNRHIDKAGGVEIDLFNPSIGDFILARYATNLSVLKSVFISLRTDNSILTLFSLHASKRIADLEAHEIVTTIYKNAIDNELANFPLSYLTRIFVFIVSTLQPSRKLKSAMEQVSDHILQHYRGETLTNGYLRTLMWALEQGRVTSAEALAYVDEHVDECSDDDEIESCWRLLELIPIATPEKLAVCERFENSIIELISDNLDEFIDPSVAYSEADYGDYDFARERLADMVDQKLAEWGVISENITGSLIVEGYDVERHMDKYHQNSYEGDYESPGISGGPVISDDAAINDLFDRS